MLLHVALEDLIETGMRHIKTRVDFGNQRMRAIEGFMGINAPALLADGCAPNAIAVLD
jgi:hypothetical protein